MEDEMTDTVETTTENTEAAPAPKIVTQPHPCLCQAYRLVDPADADGVFATDCSLTTKATFAQGHDARLVAFLVDGHFDGYEIRATLNGVETVFLSPGEAVADVSAKLQGKAEKATQNRADRDAKKKNAEAEREAKRAAKKAETEAAKAEKKAAAEQAKAEKKAAKQAEVVAGSREGEPMPLADGQVAIKVGRFEYAATIDDEGNATYIDGAGSEQTVERDGYRTLAPAL
jgi:hypothetical protein